MSSLRAFVAAATLTLAATSCIGGNDGSPGNGLRATRVDGSVAVQAPGGASRPLRKGTIVRPGSALITAKDGRVRLEGDENRAVELAGGTRATLVGAGHLSLDLGAALAETGKGRFAFDSGGVGIRVSDGAAKIDRRLGILRVGVYLGAAVVDLLGRSLDIPAYRQQDFSGGVPLDRDPSPLSLDEADPWDRSLLGDVLELDRGIGQFVRGFNSEFGTQAAAPVFFASFVPGTRVVETARRAPDDLSAGDTLVGLVFAKQQAAHAGNDAFMVRYFGEMSAEFQQGASWGLIAKERGLDMRALLPAVLDAISRGTTPASTPGGGGGSGGGGGGGGAQPTSKPTSRPRPTPSGSPSPGPTTEPTPTPCDILDRLLGNCGTSSSAATGSANTANCSVLGVLTDPDC